MRIGIDCRAVATDWAGMHTYVSQLVRGLRALGTDEIVPLEGVGDAAYRMLKLGVRGVEKHVGDVDVFHTPTFWPLKQKRGAGVATIADVTPLVEPAWHTARRVFTFRRILPRMLKRARRIIAISEATKRDVVRFYGIEPERVDVTLLAASPRFRPHTEAEAKPALAKHGLEWRGYVLCTGTIEPRKNVGRLVEAHARAGGPPLVLVGKPGWKSGPILKRIAEARDVRMLGFVGADDLPAIVAGAALFVYPSLYEGFGLPPLEAMQSGVPVVSSNASSLPEVVGDAAITVDPTDVDALADGMKRALGDGRLREAGLARAAKFSWERTAKATLESYRRAMNA